VWWWYYYILRDTAMVVADIGTRYNNIILLLYRYTVPTDGIYRNINSRPRHACNTYYYTYDDYVVAGRMHNATERRFTGDITALLLSFSSTWWWRPSHNNIIIICSVLQLRTCVRLVRETLQHEAIDIECIYR